MKTNQDSFNYNQEMAVIREHSGAVYLQLRLDHLWYLDGDCSTAVVLSYLLNLLRLKDTNPRDRDVLEENELWFKCPAKSICSALFIKQDRQNRAVKVLVKKKIIRAEHRGGFQLWIKVRTSKLQKIEEDYQENQRKEKPGAGKPFRRKRETLSLGNGKPFRYEGEEDEFDHEKTGVKRTSENPSNKPTKKEKKEPPSASRNGSVRLSFLPVDEENARRFFEALREKNKIKRNTQEFKLWPTALAKVRKDWGEERLTPLLKWYCRHVGEEFIPEAYSPRSFGEKFVRIESAMLRERSESNGRREHVSAM